jgi:DNA-binding NarL/FixJ family response regulator
MEKLHQNKDWLAEQIASGKTSKKIADEHNLSYKLVELYLRKFEIPFTPKKS